MNGVYFDREGNGITFDRWMELQSPDHFRIAVDEIGSVIVSTVWCGISSGSSDRPLIFETMVFGGTLDEEQVRYASEDAARKGHAAMIARVMQAEGVTS